MLREGETEEIHSHAHILSSSLLLLCLIS
jgi:hypothetical protein